MFVIVSLFSFFPFLPEKYIDRHDYDKISSTFSSFFSVSLLCVWFFSFARFLVSLVSELCSLTSFFCFLVLYLRHPQFVYVRLSIFVLLACPSIFSHISFIQVGREKSLLLFSFSSSTTSITILASSVMQQT